MHSRSEGALIASPRVRAGRGRRAKRDGRGALHLASLHSGFASTAIEQAWATEIERRSAEIDAGKAVLRDWDEVRDEILADLRDRP